MSSCVQILLMTFIVALRTVMQLELTKVRESAGNRHQSCHFTNRTQQPAAVVALLEWTMETCMAIVWTNTLSCQPRHTRVVRPEDLHHEVQNLSPLRLSAVVRLLKVVLLLGVD